MGSFIVTSLVSMVSFGGGVPCAQTILVIQDSFEYAKQALVSEDLRQIEIRFAKIDAKKTKRQAELESERLRIQGNLRYLEAMLERDVYGK